MSAPRLLFRGDVLIASGGEFIGKPGQFKVVRGEKDIRLGAFVQIFRGRPRQREPVKRARPAPDFVQQDEAFRRRVLQNAGEFVHLHHEGAASARDVVRRADAGVDALEQGQYGAFGWNEGADLSE